VPGLGEADTSPSEADVAAALGERCAALVRGRRTVVVGGVAAGFTELVRQLVAFGATDVLLVAQGVGTGELPSDDEVSIVVVPGRAPATVTEEVRFSIEFSDHPPADAVAAVEAFDPDGSALCLLNPVATTDRYLDQHADCDRYGMPLMIEPLVMAPHTERGGYMVDGDAQKIVTLVRLAREMGADIVKADPTTDAQDFHRVVLAARCPVLVRGGGREDLRQVFARSRQLLDQGAVGLVYGRNVYQHQNPSAVVRALMAMIHDGASAEAAWHLYEATGAQR